MDRMFMSVDVEEKKNYFFDTAVEYEITVPGVKIRTPTFCSLLR
jgi:hypothetical protein